jgi:hypothetical protein
MGKRSFLQGQELLLNTVHESEEKKRIKILYREK